MPQHIRAAREALLNYIYKSGKASAVMGKLIFLQGSPVLEDKKGVALGRPFRNCSSLCTKLSIEKSSPQLGHKLY